jgi:uncharacterized protein YbjT (DUF2867 family)
VVEGLIAQGKTVSVITSKADKVAEIEQMGARALVGDVNDASFVRDAFRGAEVVYTMIPPIWHTNDWRKAQNVIADNYVASLTANRVPYVVNLSSVGAHLGHGCGPVDGLYDYEQKLDAIPGLHVKHLRPAYFYHNFLAQIPMVKGAGILGGNYGGNHTLFLVHPRDIAQVALQELLNPNFTGSSVRYIAGDEKEGKEIAAIIGKAIGKELPWVEFSDEQQLGGALEAGLPPAIAQEYTHMGHALRDGSMQEDIRKHRPAFSPTKLADFAQEFAQAYRAS